MSCATRFEADLKASRGSLIILNSTAAYATTSAIPAYNASKAGLLGLTRALAQNWGRHGVRVNGIAPGMVATRMTRIATGDPERLAAYVARVPQGRIGAVEDVAGVALFLASDLAGHIVGQTIIVDGGMTLG
jgi:3-oxoacyl-[acyl-carrier protein] reductase